MTLSAIQVVLLVLAWSAYAVLHSALASLTVKRWVAARWPHRAHGYRLGFNLLAVVLLLPPLWLTFGWRGALLWSWSGSWAWVANGLALAAVAGFVWSTRYYDMAEFSGGAQWRTARSRIPAGCGCHRCTATSATPGTASAWWSCGRGTWTRHGS